MSEHGANAETERVETLVVGAGQAGLSVGYHLAKRDRAFLILEAKDKVGDVWRQRFDSLRLFTPARYNGLPGWGFPGAPWSFPSGQEMGEYLEAYAKRFELPVRTGAGVDELTKRNGRYRVSAGERSYEADQVVIASGTWQQPVTPGFAAALDPAITQLHSDDYRNPGQLQEGPALVVGASHSGADIAFELCSSRETILSGPVRGQIPFDIEGRAAHRILPVLWFMANHVLTERTPIGRKMREKVRSSGGPLLRVKRADLDRAGVEHVEEKVAGVEGGKPALESGRVLEVANVIWCTGFRADLSWLRIPVVGDDGWPDQRRGEVESAPGLYFVGLPFLYAFASMLVGGVGRDAKRVAERIAARAE